MVLRNYQLLVYDPTGMTDSEVLAFIGDFCVTTQAPVGCLAVDDVRNGTVCGGGVAVCGSMAAEGCLTAALVVAFAMEKTWEDTEIQERAILETTRIFQRQYAAPLYATPNGGGCGKNLDWRAVGARWWMEGSAVWVADRLPRLYPDKFKAPAPESHASLKESCRRFKSAEQDSGVRLANAVQAGNAQWQHLVDSGQLSTTLHDGGYCATKFAVNRFAPPARLFGGGLSEVINLARLLNAMRGTNVHDSWEPAFLAEFNSFQTMEDFYEQFEAERGLPNFVYDPPPSLAGKSEGQDPSAGSSSIQWKKGLYYYLASTIAVSAVVFTCSMVLCLLTQLYICFKKVRGPQVQQVSYSVVNTVDDDDDDPLL